MYAARRKAMLDAIGEGVVVLPAAPVAIRNNDVEHAYRQSSDLYYLTGFDEPESVLVLSNRHPDHRAVIFLRRRDPARETWDGPRLGVERAVEALGVDAAFPIDELAQRLPDYLENAVRAHYGLGDGKGFDETFLEALRVSRTRRRGGKLAPSEIIDPGETLHELRMRKESAEIDRMRRAAEITRDAHVAAMGICAPGVHEYEIEAELLRVFRRSGSPRPAYASIVGSGDNATILHYHQNDRLMEDGDLLLVDAGAEFDYYASDVTRTYPVNGRFSKEQAAIYDLVLRAQKASIDAVAPGATIEGVHEVSVGVLVDGLIDLGLLEGAREEAIEKGSYRSFYMHRTSHWLGMDVHDVGSYHRDGSPRPFDPGVVLTVEPGLYIPRDAEVDECWRGIGVRIEDDILVTENGHRNLTADIPRERSEVEELVGSALAAR